MKKLIFTAIMALFSCVAFGQSYDINFDVIEEAGPFLGKEWDFNYKPKKTMTVKFDGQWLDIKYKESGNPYYFTKVNSVKVVDVYDEYDGTKLKEKNYILETAENGMRLYCVIKYSYISKYSMLKTCHIPFVYKDGIIMSYTILQSDFIPL